MKEFKKHLTVGELIEILKGYDTTKLIHIAYNDEDGDNITLIDENALAVFLVAITE